MKYFIAAPAPIDNWINSLKEIGLVIIPLSEGSQVATCESDKTQSDLDDLLATQDCITINESELPYYGE